MKPASAGLDPAEGTILSPELLPAGLLQALLSRGAIAGGSVHIVNVEPIQARLGDRWEGRRAQVWGHVEQVLRRLLRTEDTVARLDETRFVVSQLDRSPVLGEVTCVRAAAELMRFFLGEATPANVQVAQVTGIDDDRLACTAIGSQHLESVVVGAAHRVDPALSHSFPVLSRRGRNLAIELALRPIWRVTGSPRHIGHYACVRMYDADTGHALGGADGEGLAPADVGDLDREILAKALELRRVDPDRIGAVVAPVSFRTLTNSSSRYGLQQFMHRLPAAERAGAVWDLTGISAGVPAGRLAEVVAIARASCRGIMCRADLSPPMAEKLRRVMATLSVHRSEAQDENAILTLAPEVRRVQSLVPAILLHDVRPDLLPLAGYIGVTHCTLAG